MSNISLTEHIQGKLIAYALTVVKVFNSSVSLNIAATPENELLRSYLLGFLTTL